MKRPPRLAPAVIYCDEHLVAVNKPAGMLTVPGRGDEACLQDVLRTTDLVAQPPPSEQLETPGGRRRPHAELRFAPDEPLRVVHRLDAEASGVLVFARTLDAQRHLVRQFAAPSVEKLYLALVGGYVADDGEVDLPIGSVRGTTRMRIDRRHGKHARTLYRILERISGHTLLECRPLTGRTHQIRVHMAAIGHPLSVDPLYGGGQAILLSDYKPGYRPTRDEEERPLIARLTLHAASLSLIHPASGQPVKFEAPPPKDFRAMLKQLGRLK